MKILYGTEAEGYKTITANNFDTGNPVTPIEGVVDDTKIVAINVGTYYVWYKVVGNDNYNANVVR